MTNIPFNTVASVLGTGAATRQVAAVHDRKFHEAMQAQRKTVQRVQEHTEAVEDPADYGVLGVGDEARERRDQEKQKEEKGATEERVDIAGVEAKPVEEKGNAEGRLDISA